MYRLSIDKPMTGDRITAFISDFESWQQPELLKYKRYYEGKHDVLRRVMADDSKPNNRICSPYANYITSTMSSYFMGNNVTYKSEDEGALEALNETFRYNDEASENLSLAKDASVYGRAFELVYIDAEGDIRFRRLDPLQCIAIYDTTLEEELLYVIRYYKDVDILDRSEITKIEVYDREKVTYYDSIQGIYRKTGEMLHGFKGYVPICVYRNNEDELNDFGKVISLIDAYDNSVSDSINDLDSFTDAYLVLKGIGAIDDETLTAMKQNKILLLDNDSDAQWLIKDSTQSDANSIKDRLNDDIFKFASCLDLTSDISAVSGIAIKYRLISMENAASAKETQFKKGLLRRIELISLITAALTPDILISDIEITFNRNIPTDLTEAADTVVKLSGILSDETLLGLLPIVEDPQKELEKKNAEISIYDTEDDQDTELEATEAVGE